MSRKYNYEVGATYGLKKLVSLEYIEGKGTMANVECINCGRKSMVKPYSLHDPKCVSCTCQIRSADGESETKLYRTYSNMKYRCYTETAQEFYNYGGRGITVCDEWMGKNGFANFRKWALANGYVEGLSIDRIDGDEGYSPENCRWVTRSENTRNANLANRVQHRKANRGEYYGIDPNGIFYKFWNANKFAKDMNLKASEVRRCANLGRRHHGWVFGFTQDLSNEETQSTIESRESEQVEYTAGEIPAVEAPGAA